MLKIFKKISHKDGPATRSSKTPNYDYQGIKTVKEHRDSLAAALNKNVLKKSDLKPTLRWLNDLVKDEKGPRNASRAALYLRQDFLNTLESQGIYSGLIAEIGGPFNSFSEEMPNYDFHFLSLYPVEGNSNVIVTDITQAEHLPDERYDAIFSKAVFEHVKKPWKAAHHLSRMLKPGGIMYHMAPFSYFYHGAPSDYWRYTTDGFEVLFSNLKTLKSEFYGNNRRRDNRGSPSNRVDRDGGAQFAVDSFGGWRENWHTIYVGIKDQSFLTTKIETSKKQVIINLMHVRTKKGDSISEAATTVSNALQGWRVNYDQELSKNKTKDDCSLSVTENEIREIWRKRGRIGWGIVPSYNRFAMAAKLGILND